MIEDMIFLYAILQLNFHTGFIEITKAIAMIAFVDDAIAGSVLFIPFYKFFQPHMFFPQKV